ncbi:MAG: hypothetical protein QF752_13260 [Planctomycetota bacterium]|jgi:hypothetical protein|nr:hypothetical protein [Planctomycetota bacterium]
MKRSLTFLLALSMMGASTACVRVVNNSQDRMIPPEIGQSLRSGRTTYSDVLVRLGPPSDIGNLAEGFFFRYRNTTSSGFQILARLHILVKFGVAFGGGDISTLLLYFDQDGVLDRWILDSYPEDLGWGYVAGHFGSPNPHLHFEFIPNPTGVHRWGMNLLERPFPQKQSSSAEN